MTRTVFVHGSGRAGATAWPSQLTWPDAVFLERPGFAAGENPVATDFEREAALVAEACGDRAVVIAHSYGSLPAILAAEITSTPVSALVLCEPAAFSLARGGVAVEAHIAAVAPVMRSAASLTAAEFQVRLYEALGVPNVEAPRDREAVLGAERMRLQVPPWDVTLDPTVFERVPTLIVTGGWNAEYEEVGKALELLSARHEVLEGHGHRPQDSPEFERLVRTFLG